MTSPSSEQVHAAFDSENRPGVDMYGIGTGALIMPNGSVVAVWQGDDRLASSLIAAWWEEWNK